MRVLVAEDERINQLYMSHLLVAAGHGVELASDGVQAIEGLHTARCDVILMDVQMPNLDGVEATRRIRSGVAGDENRDIPIVALTAYTSAEDTSMLVDAGVSRVMSKPIVENELLRTLRALVSESDGKGGPA